MKRIIKVFAAVLAASFLLITVPASADWETHGKRTYYSENGAHVKGWQTIDGKKYYFNNSGIMQTGCIVIDGARYNFGTDGVCQGKFTGIISTPKGRQYWKDGELCKSRWIHSANGKRKYYAKKNGILATGKTTVKGEPFEFDKKGKLIAGEDKAAMIAFMVYDDNEGDEEYFDQYVYALDADGYYYQYEADSGGIRKNSVKFDVEKDGWYEMMMTFEPCEKIGQNYSASAKSVKLITDFSQKLEKYADTPMSYDYPDDEDDGGLYITYGIYRDKNGEPRSIKLCTTGDGAGCVNDETVINFVNAVSDRSDLRVICSPEYKFYPVYHMGKIMYIGVYENYDNDRIDRQNIYMLDEKGGVYYVSTGLRKKHIYFDEDNWYRRLSNYETTTVSVYDEETDSYKGGIGAELTARMKKFADGLEKYSDIPMKSFSTITLTDSKAHEYYIYGVYYDEEDNPSCVQICSIGTYTECIDSPDVISFVNDISAAGGSHIFKPYIKFE